MPTLEELRQKANQSLKSIAAGLCGCHRCINGRKELAMHMVLCETCGNKRCPHASDHNLACTGSNEPGQPGSVYEITFRPQQ